MMGNLMIAVGGTVLTFLGPLLLTLIGSQIHFPGSRLMLLLWLAFQVELNIFVLVAYINTVRPGEMSHYLVYLKAAVACVVVLLAIRLVNGRLSLGLLVGIPLFVQALFSLPAVLFVASRHVGMSRRELIRAIMSVRVLRSLCSRVVRTGAR
jgi:hypothetical protein